ncbi:MAG: hypothetical protein IT569_00265 [Leptospiraceae bacterium]|nr:hypothetical protein [Leptospiraceae bacterium]
MNQMIFLIVMFSVGMIVNNLGADEVRIFPAKGPNEYILLLKDQPMHNDPKISNAKIIGNCPISTVVTFEKYAYVIKGKMNSDTMYYINCLGKRGWMLVNFKEIEMDTNKNYLMTNIERIKLSRQFDGEISGAYNGQEIGISIADRDNHNVRLSLLGPDEIEGTFPNYKRLLQNRWEISNNETTLIISYSKAGLKVEVVKDTTDKFKKIHNNVYSDKPEDY